MLLLHLLKLAVAIVVDDVSIPSSWVRDHAIGQGLETTELRTAVVEATEVVRVERNGSNLEVTWADGVSTLHDVEWLLENAPKSSIDEKRVWEPLEEELKSFEYSRLARASERLALFRALRKYGAVVVQGAPVEAHQQETAFSRVIDLFESDYGKVWLTQGVGRNDTILSTDDIADSDKATSWLASRVEYDASVRLEDHTDSSFWSNPAGLVFFHMLRPADRGGDTLLSDGFAAAETLRLSDPAAFRTLCQVEVRWKYKPRALDQFYVSKGTVLRVEGGQLKQFRWSNKDREILRVAPEQVDAFYDAYRKLSSLIRRVRVRLEPGSFLVLDNWRVSHGRMPYVGRRELHGAYATRDHWDSKQRLLEYAESTGQLATYDLPEPNVVSYRRLDQGTRSEFLNQGPAWASLVSPLALAERALDLLTSMDSESTRFGFRVNAYEHALQTATLAHRDGRDEAYVVMALFHDVGEAVWPANHGEIAAAMLRPYVSEELYFILKYHDLFQGYHYAHHFDLDRHARRRLQGSPFYQACADFTDLYDARAFDETYASLPLSFFEPMVSRLFQTKPYEFNHDDPKNTVAWQF